MANRRASLAGEVADPVAAGRVGGLVARERRSVRLRAGQDVVAIRRLAASVDDLALLGEGGLLGEVVLLAMQLRYAAGDEDALGVVPGPGADRSLALIAGWPAAPFWLK